MPTFTSRKSWMCARSTPIAAEPFMKCGAEGEWNSCESGHPYAFRDDDGKAYLFYQGSNDMGKTWYLSKVEIDFDENGNPFYK